MCYTKSMKRCYRCKKLKKYTSTSRTKVYYKEKFYIYPNRVTCRACNTESVKRYRATPNGRTKINEAVRRSTKKYPERQKARQLLARAIWCGTISKPILCTRNSCKEQKIEGHHPDYSLPLKVVWLCKKHHSDLHSKSKT